MTPKAQRIAIAEACGWTRYNGKEKFQFYSPRGMYARMENLPDYLADLNAMHEAEKVLSVREKQNYISTLRNICVVAGCWPETATADQRAEAFLRTVGKWEENTK
jgi:hypothetical protein